ncbi:MarR family winged helix-turn-helix transcriptional regulator [Saccharopolyspora sp. NPDC002376]
MGKKQEPHRLPSGVGFLLAQLGTHAAANFASGIEDLDLTPPQAGLLWMLARKPGRSQRELADNLGMPPSRFVQFADKLEERGLIERRRNPDDRRLHALHLTEQGLEVLGKLGIAARRSEDVLCRTLTDGEREQLAALLGRIAGDQGLSPGVHPGYKSVRT